MRRQILGKRREEIVQLELIKTRGVTCPSDYDFKCRSEYNFKCPSDYDFKRPSTPRTSIASASDQGKQHHTCLCEFGFHRKPTAQILATKRRITSNCWLAERLIMTDGTTRHPSRVLRVRMRTLKHGQQFHRTQLLRSSILL
jgi:hypothetical protein